MADHTDPGARPPAAELRDKLAVIATHHTGTLAVAFAAATATLREFARLIDGGPNIPLRPEVYAALARDYADMVEQPDTDTQPDDGGVQADAP